MSYGGHFSHYPKEVRSSLMLASLARRTNLLTQVGVSCTQSMNIEHISVSRSDVWETCQQKYKFRYHLKVPSGPQPPYFLYGKLVHKIAEEYTKCNGEKSIDEIRYACLNGEIPLEENKENQPVPREKLPKEYLNKLNKHIVSFMKLTDRLGLGGQCEWQFEYDLDPPNKKHLFGFIDRLIEKNGEYLIVDYKTTKKGRWRRTKRDITHDLQLQCYALVTHKVLGIDPTKIKAALFYLEGAEFIGASFSQETLDKVEKQMLGIYNDIESSDPNKVRAWVGNHCNYCDYMNICPFYSLT